MSNEEAMSLEGTMKALLTICLLAVASTAGATGGHHGKSGSSAAAAAVSGAASMSSGGHAVGKGGDGGHAVAKGGAGGDAVAKGGRATVKGLRAGDNAVNTNVTEQTTVTYREPPVAVAGFSNNVISECQRIFGLDFRGASQSGAGGASFGLPWNDGACQLEKATAQAFALGNAALGWKLFCSQKAVWRAYQAAEQAVAGYVLTREGAIAGCIASAQVAAPAEYATRQEVNEKIERAFQRSAQKSLE